MPHEVISTREDGSLLVDMFFSEDDIHTLFPCIEADHDRVHVSDAARAWACQALGVADAATIQWHAPDVFSIRYGSSFAAGARAGSSYVRFHTTEGNFQEGDDQ